MPHKGGAAAGVGPAFGSYPSRAYSESKGPGISNQNGLEIRQESTGRNPGKSLSPLFRQLEPTNSGRGQEGAANQDASFD